MVVLGKRYCVEYVDGSFECFRDGGFWYTEKGLIIKWAILGSIFALFTLWFVGGYLHARRRLRTGKPLLAYHRFLVSAQDRSRYGQTPQNNFTFYAAQNPYQSQNSYQSQNQNRPAYAQRQDGTWPDPPPLYNGADAPPVYGAPPGATKANPNQSGGALGMEMQGYGVPPPPPQQQQQQQQQGQQQSGDVEAGQVLPPRPPQRALAGLRGFTERFRK